MCWNALDNEPGVVRFTMTLIRHGQTINNLLQKIQGQKSDASLNWKGQVQALTIARCISLYMELYKIDLIATARYEKTNQEFQVLCNSKFLKLLDLVSTLAKINSFFSDI